MHILSSVDITGFYGGTNTISFSFKPDVNFFIGRNGTGKTRLMNLLNASLTGDVRALVQARFEKLVFKFIEPEKKTRPSLTILKETSANEKGSISFAFSRSGDKPVIIKFDNATRAYPEFMIAQYGSSLHAFSNGAPSHLKRQLDELFNSTLLSITRENQRATVDDKQKFDSPLDQKVTQVVRDFGSYFSVLDKEAASATEEFQKNYFLSLLFSSNRISEISSTLEMNLDEEQSTLTSIFNEFGLSSKLYADRLKDHFTHLKNASQSFDANSAIDANNLLVLVDSIRIHEVVQQWHSLENRRKSIYEPKTDFIDIMNKLLYKKTVSVNDGNQTIVARDKEQIQLVSLSSGEKQLFVLLGETLLQRRQPYIFLADEPELSLHLDWQVNLVPSLREINPRAQIIFATHSPDVVGAYQKNTIDLEKIA